MKNKNTTKGKVQHNKRVRFCSLDYYRTICTNSESDIQGIKRYACDDNFINVEYDTGIIIKYPVFEGKKQLKQVVKEINKYLGGH